MCRLSEIITVMERIAPPELMESWDNSGLQIGSRKAEIDRILLCLDVDEYSVREAIDKNVQLIISHHPLFFNPLTCLDFDQEKAGLIKELIRNEINVYSAHTTWDKTIGGVNFQLLNMLDLTYAGTLEPHNFVSGSCISENDDPYKDSICDNKYMCGLGCLGLTNKTYSFDEYLQFVKKRLQLPVLKFGGDLHRQINLVAMCGGAGASLTHAAAKSGAQLFITGDIKYHEAQEMLAEDLCFIDGGHFPMENPSMSFMRERLLTELDNEGLSAEVFIGTQRDVFSWV